MTTTTTTKSLEVADDMAALLRARSSLFWITTREEARVEGYIFEAAAAAGMQALNWDCGQGVTDIAGKPVEGTSVDVGDVLREIGQRAYPDPTRRLPPENPTVWIMRDLPIWLQGPLGAGPLRQLRNLARSLPNCPIPRAQAVVVLSPSGEVPPELSAHATVIDWPLPDREEIGVILDEAVEPYLGEIEPLTNGARAAAVDAAIGLTGEEAQACISKSLVQLRRVDSTAISREKKRVITRERVLEWHDPIPGGLDAVGGLDVLKPWLLSRSAAYSPRARAYGLPAPRGCLLVGVPGCGKTLTAKAVATAWGIPLLRLDLGALKGKFVGQSETNIRKAFATIEAIGRCVVWIDELEKALQGATSGASDGGVSADALGAILSWMQERRGEAFVIATANDVEQLPPELLRKGRWDEVWAIDLPTARERAEIIAASARQYGRDLANVLKAKMVGESETRLAKLVDATESFTGSEIAALVPDALFAAFADGEREITVDDLLVAAKTVTPLATTSKEKIARLREWAKTRARAATSPETATAATAKRAGRLLDLKQGATR